MYKGKFLDEGESLNSDRFEDETERHPKQKQQPSSSGSLGFASDLASRFRGDQRTSDYSERRRLESWVYGLGCCVCCLVLLVVILLATLLSRSDDSGGGSGSVIDNNSNSNSTNVGGATPVPSPAPTPIPTGPPFTYFPTDTRPTLPPGATPQPTDTDTRGHTTFVKNLVMYNAIIGASPDGGTAVQTDGTPQRHAYVWLQDEDELGLNRRNLEEHGGRGLRLEDWQLVQRYTAAVFYFSTNVDETWTSTAKTNWLSITQTECEWEGVSCDGQYRITGLEFQDSGIGGTLPREMVNLEHLVILGIDNTGGIHGKLSGGIPAEFANLTSLSIFHLQGNDFTEPLPDHLFENWYEINTINLNSNTLPGSIPSSVDALESCTDLDLSHNRLTNEIPPQISGMENVGILKLNNNELTGQIREEDFQHLVKCRTLLLGFNSFTGAVPSFTAMPLLSNVDLTYLPEVSGSILNATCDLINGNAGTYSVDCDKVTCFCCSNCS